MSAYALDFVTVENIASVFYRTKIKCVGCAEMDISAQNVSNIWKHTVLATKSNNFIFVIAIEF